MLHNTVIPKTRQEIQKQVLHNNDKDHGLIVLQFNNMAGLID